MGRRDEINIVPRTTNQQRLILNMTQDDTKNLYEVLMAQSIWWTVNVRADSEEEAMEVAMDNCPCPSEASGASRLKIDDINEIEEED